MLLPRDGTTLITSEAEEAIRLWDARTGKPRDTSGCPVLVPSQLAFSPDGRKLIAYSRRGTVYHWQTATGKLLSRTRLAGAGDDRDESRRRFLACGGQYVAEILPEGLDLFDGRHGGISYRYPGAIRELVLALGET